MIFSKWWEYVTLAYIKQFNAMEKVLIGKMKEREKGIAVRQALTSALQQSQENDRMHGHACKQSIR